MSASTLLAFAPPRQIDGAFSSGGGGVTTITSVATYAAPPAALPLSGDSSSTAWGAPYTPITMTPGKTYLVTGTIEMILALGAASGYGVVELLRSLGAPVDSFVVTKQNLAYVSTTESTILSFSAVVPAGTNTQLDVQIVQGNTGVGTEVDYTLHAFSAVQLD